MYLLLVYVSCGTENYFPGYAGLRQGYIHRYTRYTVRDKFFFSKVTHCHRTSSPTMVKVEIVDEKEVGQSPYASSSDSRTSSSASISSVESDISVDESFFDRVAALVDIVPPTTRHSIASRISKTASIFKRSGKLVGNIVWVVTTSALLVALPLALTLEDEAKIVAQEKEMLEQQQGAQQVCFSCLTGQSFLTFISDACTFHVPIWLKFWPATTKITCPSWFLAIVSVLTFNLSAILHAFSWRKYHHL